MLQDLLLRYTYGCGFDGGYWGRLEDGPINSILMIEASAGNGDTALYSLAEYSRSGVNFLDAVMLLAALLGSIPSPIRCYINFV